MRVASLEPSGAARYFLTDQVDSVKIVADSSGKVVSRTEYHPYGETWFSEGSEDIAPKYNGQELDQESDFYYFNARHYDPELARFVTADIIVDGEEEDPETGLIVSSSLIGFNRYAYTRNNPIKYKDPTGHESLDNLVGSIISEELKEIGQKVDQFVDDTLEALGNALSLQTKASSTAVIVATAPIVAEKAIGACMGAPATCVQVGEGVLDVALVAAGVELGTPPKDPQAVLVSEAAKVVKEEGIVGKIVETAKEFVEDTVEEVGTVLKYIDKYNPF